MNNRIMNWRIGATLALMAVFGLSACNAMLPTPVVVTAVVIATNDPRVIQVTVTDTPSMQQASQSATPAPSTAPTLATNTAVPATPTAASTASVAPTQPPPTTAPVTAAPNTAPTQAPVQFTPGALPNPTSTPVPTINTSAVPVLPFPTDTNRQINIAQEDFQGGYMFWLQATREIWVLLPDPLPKPGDAITLPTAGQWRVYKDAYQDGEPEVDASLNPPSATLYQPRRGFGKLWRTTPELRNVLGWATTPEFALSTSYEYHPGGTINAQATYVPGPGRHVLISLSRNTFEFTEPAPGSPFGTWKRIG